MWSVNGLASFTSASNGAMNANGNRSRAAAFFMGNRVDVLKLVEP
jgi:hypothetical protein